MRRRTIIPAGVLAAAIVLGLTGSAPTASAEVNVNINIGPPPVVVAEPPEMVVIPRTMVYFAPGVDVELLFYRGWWWTPRGGRWYRARAYNGPWVVIGPRYVPVEIVRLPRDYRTVYIRERHVPYGLLKKDWEHREYERRRRMGEWKEWKEEKHERREWEKERRKEWKEHGRGHGRGDD
ncbi:MAG: hypothetical protein M1550_02040 [Deltaproteobacteria bacterium]|nr:hypothetical protein [Deltaproteobacteria bacterium]